MRVAYEVCRPSATNQVRSLLFDKAEGYIVPTVFTRAGRSGPSRERSYSLEGALSRPAGPMRVARSESRARIETGRARRR